MARNLPVLSRRLSTSADGDIKQTAVLGPGYNINLSASPFMIGKSPTPRSADGPFDTTVNKYVDGALA